MPTANTRSVRATGARPVDLLATDRAAMGALPPLAPATGTAARVRLRRDYYVRAAGNDYFLDPSVIGRFVDVVAALDRVQVTCAGRVVADHARSWASRQVITDPAHVAIAAELRTAFAARTAATRGPAAAGAEVGMRALSDDDEIFALTSPDPVPRARLEVVR